MVLLVVVPRKVSSTQQCLLMVNIHSTTAAAAAVLINTHLSLWLVVICTGCCTWLHTLGVRPPVGWVLALDEDESKTWTHESDMADTSRSHSSVSQFFDYRELSAVAAAAAAAWLCACDAATAWGCESHGTAGGSPAAAPPIGGSAGREVGIMYSDSSSLSRPSSPVACLGTGDGLKRGRAWVQPECH